mmetsp:Transcript_6377/g.19782  ORF Transcript_6377/g.19782 Transcript_6377/m.19782 type:complete len:833 (-) Transcript_6377:104-2602(-)
MQTLKGSYHNLQALAQEGPPAATPAATPEHPPSRLGQASMARSDYGSSGRVIVVSNHLPLRTKHGASGWTFEWDEDALVAQAKEGVPSDLDVLYVGTLPVAIDPEEQDVTATHLKEQFGCVPVFIETDLKDRYYKGFCKQLLWPLFHYILPISPLSASRFDLELWQAYVKANMAFAEAIVDEVVMESDFVWIHDYHLLVLPSLLRKRLNRVRCGLFLHSPFPSSEIFRTFPKREELLRSLLNADLIGFHTFDYARHFLSCCSRMLGLEHVTSRGSIAIEYHGRTVGLKIMPTGLNPQRYVDGFKWDEFKWRRGELRARFSGKTVLVGVDDMDVFKGIELKLLAFERLLHMHPEWHGKLALVQITNPPRSSGKDVNDLHRFVTELVDRINARFSVDGFAPVQYIERHVPLHERMAFYSVSDVAVVTATRDGMNLVPYEYILCRQSTGEDEEPQPNQGSMLVVSEFVGCSPSLSGAIRVNPWSVEAVCDGMYSAIKTPLEHRRMRHEKHWKYVSTHTVAYWAQSFIQDLHRVTKNHATMKCYGLGLGLDTYRMVALDSNFRRLNEETVRESYKSSRTRVLLLDYDGTLTTHRAGSGIVSLEPSADVIKLLSALTSDTANYVVVLSGRSQTEISGWFQNVPNLGLVAENGYYVRQPGNASWETMVAYADFEWKEMAMPILRTYAESTDGSYIEVKDSALVWSYRDADPDFGSWQAKELLDHLEGVLSNQPVDIVGVNTQVEIKPQGVSKGQVVEHLLGGLTAGGKSPDFVLCIGDDRTDEDMFIALEAARSTPRMVADVFECTVGQKPSRAPFYLNDPSEVQQLMVQLTHPGMMH